MDIVTKEKKSCTAYRKPGSHKSEKGRPPKKGAAVHELFVSHAGQFHFVKNLLKVIVWH